MPDKHPIEDLRAGSDVFDTDGEKVGTLFAIVLNPSDDRVSDVAIDLGPYFPEPGFGSPTIVSAEISHVRSANGDGVNLDLSNEQVNALPVYEHEHFFAIPREEQSDEKPSRLWSIAQAVAASLSSIGGIAVPAEHFAKAPFERHILDDAPVWRDEPNTHIGDVERVLVDDATDHIVGLVIKRGVVTHEEVVLPMKYVTEIRDGAIIVQVSDKQLESLAPFTG